MSELSYKELQEQGVFDVPYRAFKYMQSQQAKIDELQKQVVMQDLFYDQSAEIKNSKLKIEELQKKHDAMYNAFVVADDCRKEWHESYMNARKERDEMQAMVNSAEKAIMICEEYDHAEKLNEIYNLLKGNKDE